MNDPRENPTPEPAPAKPNLPAVSGAVAFNANDPTGPVVILKITSGAAEFTVKIDARQAPQFMMNMTEGVIQAASSALAAAGPQLVTPGQSPIILPGGMNGRPRTRRPHL